MKKIYYVAYMYLKNNNTHCASEVIKSNTALTLLFVEELQKNLENKVQENIVILNIIKLEQ